MLIFGQILVVTFTDRDPSMMSHVPGKPVEKLYEIMSKTYEKFVGLGPELARYEYL